jgi:glutamine synthetase
MFSSTKEVLDYIRQQEIRQIDIKVVDLQGRWRRMTYSAKHVTEKLFEEGTGISLSPYPGYRQVESGDMTVKPDVSTAFIDPFHAYPTLGFICDIYHNDGTRYPRDPRYVLQQAEAALQKVQPGCQALFSPEIEFYLFDDVSYLSDEHTCHYSVESAGVGWTDREGEPIYRSSGFEKIGQADQPLDRFALEREHIVARIENAGVKVKYHHHELGTPGQMEVEVYFDTPLRTADSLMLMKYMVKNAALERGKIATMMPRPVYGHAGNGIHFHQYIADGAMSLFYDKDGYGCLSAMAMKYLAGVLHHTPALMGIGNASTNSYRRFAPNLAAPVKRFFSLSNRSSTLRIPGYALNPEEARIEYRMPDATANPYLIVAAQLMAGLDGIRHDFDPTALGYGPFDVNVYQLPQKELDQLADIPMEFGHALQELDGDREFLLADEVFSHELIDAYLDVKRTLELAVVHGRPHPHEYLLYFDL